MLSLNNTKKTSLVLPFKIGFEIIPATETCLMCVELVCGTCISSPLRDLDSWTSVDER